MKKEEQVYISFRNAVFIIGISVAAFAVQMLCAAPFSMLPFVLAFISQPLSVMVTGALYVLIMMKAPYRGTIMLFSALFAFPFLFMGTPVVSLVFMLGGFIGELIFIKDNTRTKLKITISYAIFALSIGLGTYIPVLLSKDATLANVIEQGVSQTVVDNYDKLYTLGPITVGCLLTLITSIIGTIIGFRIFKKHFSKV